MSRYGDSREWDLVRAYALRAGADAEGLVRAAYARGVRAAELRRRYERASSFVGTFRARIWADAVSPGMLDPRVIDQAVWWVDFFGRAHRIHDERSFATDYLLNVLMFIREHAQAFVADVDNARIVLEVMHGSALLHALERELDRRLGE